MACSTRSFDELRNQEIMQGLSHTRTTSVRNSLVPCYRRWITSHTTIVLEGQDLTLNSAAQRQSDNHTRYCTARMRDILRGQVLSSTRRRGER
ncbi:hypothetical protein CERSUDRAFT_69660 [Gelatoporia subvermispora B]|uniref:Uncharacterized protein n=1 Tax=Ceriporiopsis subvermispora (strain B) TaxID=914234 RepID=M2QG31_CERS8|nr:hypothetical protein CERSUDRAFT_69660 [Gelatoporia subvermispora B]